MSKMKVKVVVGANYGDEGKGLATAYFSKIARDNDEKCLNILYNGSCQRGHTVELKDETRHVFHHFGSGTFYGAASYFDKDFIVNPIFFLEEKQKLMELGYNPIVYVNTDCRISIPFDAILNQLFEEGRGANKHGSCGFGVFETVKRNKNKDFAISFLDFAYLSYEDKYNFLKRIVNTYIPFRLEEMGYNKVPAQYFDILGGKFTDGLIKHYIEDFYSMESICRVISIGKFLSLTYDVGIFEGGQGLLLDEHNMKNFPHLTPSTTTPVPPLKRISEENWKVEGKPEICYVTRTYLTRHGAGPMLNTCPKEDISERIEDLTNVPNPHQDSLRYGHLDVHFTDRITQSIGDAYEAWGGFYIDTSILFTHMNYTPIMNQTYLVIAAQVVDTIYRSNTKFAEDIEYGRY